MWKALFKVALLGVLASGFKVVFKRRREELEFFQNKYTAVRDLLDNHLNPMYDLCGEILVLEGDILRRGCKVGDLKKAVERYRAFLRENASNMINVDEETDLSDYCIRLKDDLEEYVKGDIPASKVADILSVVIKFAEDEETALSSKIEHKGKYRWILELT
jgi:hypothetical protein